MAAPDDNLVLHRARVRAVFFVVLLLAWHASLVQRAHQASDLGDLVGLGAYCGLLGALATFLGVASNWHGQALRPGARVGHVLVGAWVLGALGAAIGAVLALLSHVTSSGAERAFGAALVGPVVAAVAAAPLAQRWLIGLARESPTSPLRSRVLQARLAVYAAFTSGMFGVLHPPVRFPAALPSGDEVLSYALAGALATGTLVPLAAWRLSRSLVHSGLVMALQGAPRPVALVVVAAGVALVAGLAVLIEPMTLAGWSAYRGLAGALLGALAAAVGCALGLRVTR